MATKAKESPQVAKARRKLKENMAEESKHFTPAALLEMRKMMENWIHRHQGERIDLKSKEIVIFDENRHSAKIHSRYITHLLQTLKNEAEKQKRPSLHGRITPG